MMIRTLIFAKTVEKTLQTVLGELTSQEGKELIDDIIDVIEERIDPNGAAQSAINFLRRLTDIPDDIGGDQD